MSKIQKPSLFLGTPMYGGMCTGFFMQSVCRLQQLMQNEGWGMQSSFVFNESLITRARNSLVSVFLKSDATHLLFIDADIGFDAVQVAQMVLADVDVICGIYPKKEINWQSVEAAVQRGEPWQNLKRHTASFVINLLDGAQSITTPVGMPFEILAGGTGCMLIKRHVIERMVQVVPSYISDTMDLSNTIDAGARIANVFDTSIDAASERLLSEDYHFCFKWREMGGKIHAAPWVQLTHTGNYNFEGGMIPEQNNG